MIAPAGQSTARAGLRSKLAALVVRRQAGPATKGLHAPWIPKVEVAEGAGYAVTPRCAGRCREATEGFGSEGLVEPARPEGL